MMGFETLDPNILISMTSFDVSQYSILPWMSSPSLTTLSSCQAALARRWCQDQSRRQARSCRRSAQTWARVGGHVMDLEINILRGYKSGRWIDSDELICHLRTCSSIRFSHRICRNFMWMDTIGTSGLLRFQLFMHDRIIYFGHGNPQQMENDCFRTYNVSPSQSHWQLVDHWVWSHWERFPPG